MIKRLLIAVAMLCAVSGAQVQVAPILQPHQTFVDQSGSPCAGCSLYSYTAGTTIPTPTYTDASGSVSNTNPIVLSTQGGANIWVDTSVSYKFTLKNAQGTTIWTVDYVKSVGGNVIFSDPFGSQTITQPFATSLDIETSGGGKLIYNGYEVLNSFNGVQTNPILDQTVTQPTGTTLSVNSLNKELNASLFTGADIGVKVNAAIAALGCGTVLIPAGTYNFTHTIIKPRCVVIRGQGAGATATRLVFTGTTAGTAAVAVGDALGDVRPGPGAIENLTITTPAGESGSGQTAGVYGLWIGGDGINGTPILPVGDFAENQTFTNTRITGFGLGIGFGNNTYWDTFNSPVILANLIGITQQGAVNSGEAIIWVGGECAANVNGCFVNAGFENVSYGLAIDFNGNATTAQIIDSNLTMFGGHMEVFNAPMYSGNGTSFTAAGVTFAEDTAGGPTLPWMFQATGISNVLSIRDSNIFSAHAVTELVNYAGTTSSTKPLTLSNISGNTNFLIAACTQSGFAPASDTFIDTTLAGVCTKYYGGATTFGGSISPGAASGNPIIILRDTTPAAPTPTKRERVVSGNYEMTNDAASQVIFSVTDGGLLNAPAISAGAGVAISNSSLVPQVGSPTVGQVACIKASGPPVLIGYCTGAVSGSSSCTCN